MTAIFLPLAVYPVASKSGLPIITSRWTGDSLSARAGFSERVPPKPEPNAMCAVAFSSSRVSKYVRPLCPIRDVASPKSEP